MTNNKDQFQPTEDPNISPARHLLIVDDEREFGEFVKTVAEAMSFKVTVTEKARDFQSAYLSSEPTHIVMDMVMPGIDGVELISWLAQQNCKADILIVTGFNPRYIELAEDLGGAKGLSKIQTLTKPVALADLRKALS